MPIWEEVEERRERHFDLGSSRPLEQDLYGEHLIWASAWFSPPERPAVVIEPVAELATHPVDVAFGRWGEGQVTPWQWTCLTSLHGRPT